MPPSFNPNDHIIWNTIFATPMAEWRIEQWPEFMADGRNFLRENRALRVLDLGCGIGRWATYLTLNGFKLTGIDFSENAITVAKDWAGEKRLEIDYRCLPVTYEGFEADTFDAVVAPMILDNISREELRQTLENLPHFVRRGGAFFALFNPFLSESQIEEMKKSDNPSKDATLINYTEKEIKSAFSNYLWVDMKTYPDWGGLRGVFAKVQ